MYAQKRHEAILNSKFDIIGNEIQSMHQIWIHISAKRNKIIDKLLTKEDKNNSSFLDTFFDKICEVLPFLDQFLRFLDDQESSQLVYKAIQESMPVLSQSLSTTTLKFFSNKGSLCGTDVTRNDHEDTLSQVLSVCSNTVEEKSNVENENNLKLLPTISSFKQSKFIPLLPKSPSSNYRNDVNSDLMLNNVYKSEPYMVLNVKPEFEEIKMEIENTTMPKSSRPIDVMVSHFKTPGEFYVQLVDDNYHLLKFLDEQMNATYVNTDKEFATKNDIKKTGKKYFAWYDIKTETWYRVRIVDWFNDRDSHTVRVQAIDFGFKDKTTVATLRQLNANLYQFKKFANRCYIKHLLPIAARNSINYTKVQWPRDVIRYIRELIEKQKSTTYIEVLSKTDNEIYAVDLLINNEYLDEHLIQFEMAIRVSDLIDMNNGVLKKSPKLSNDIENDKMTWMVAANSDADNSTTISELTIGDIYDKNNDENDLFGTEDINLAVANVKINDEAAHCRFTKNGSCFKGKKCVLSHEELRNDGHTRNQEVVVTECSSEIDNVKIGDRIEIYITHWKHLVSFYGHINVRDCNKLDIRYGSIKLKNFIKYLQTINFLKTLKKYQIMPALNELVVYQEVNNFWYRGRLIGNLSDDEYEVFAIDYGYSTNVNCANIRKPNEYILSIPYQAIACSLHNFKLNTNIPKEKLDLVSTDLQAEIELKCFNAIVRNIIDNELVVEFLDADKILKTYIDSGFLIPDV